MEKPRDWTIQISAYLPSIEKESFRSFCESKDLAMSDVLKACVDACCTKDRIVGEVRKSVSRPGGRNIYIKFPSVNKEHFNKICKTEGFLPSVGVRTLIENCLNGSIEIKAKFGKITAHETK